MHRTNSAPCCHEGSASEGRQSRSRSPKCAPANSCAPPGTCPRGHERTRGSRDFNVWIKELRWRRQETSARGYWYGDIGNRRTLTGSSPPADTRHHPPAPVPTPVHTRRPGSSPARLRPECAPVTLPQDAPRALNFHGGRGNRPGKTGSVFGQVGEAEAGSRTLRTGSAERRAYAQSGRRSSPPGPVRRPRGCRRRCPPAHWIQYSGPTHAGSMEALPPWPEKSARTGARPHSGGTSQRCVHPQNFRTDHNPAIRNNAP